MIGDKREIGSTQWLLSQVPGLFTFETIVVNLECSSWTGAVLGGNSAQRPARTSGISGSLKLAHQRLVRRDWWQMKADCFTRPA